MDEKGLGKRKMQFDMTWLITYRRRMFLRRFRPNINLIIMN